MSDQQFFLKYLLTAELILESPKAGTGKLDFSYRLSFHLSIDSSRKGTFSNLRH